MRDEHKTFALGRQDCYTLPPGEYLYAWAPGAGAVEFPDGGVRARPATATSYRSTTTTAPVSRASMTRAESASTTIAPKEPSGACSPPGP